MKALIALGLLVTLSACGFTPQGEAFRQGVAVQGAQAYDEGLVNSEFFMCQAASIGSIKRRYGVSESKAKAYKELCGAGADADVFEPNMPGEGPL